MHETFVIGCSFTDPEWQQEVPWSVQLAQTHPCYISAKAGMGIKGICTEGLAWLKTLSNIKQVIVILPTLWRIDIEMDVESYLCNSMVSLLSSNNSGYSVLVPATRKWITSGGLNFDTKTEQSKIFEFLLKHQGYLVILKEHLRALQTLIEYCKINDIEIHISAIQDPVAQLQGLEDIKDDALALLDEVGYGNWFKFNGEFIDGFLGHRHHPTTDEHSILCKHIIKLFQKD
jgi:hypothetical protein